MKQFRHVILNLGLVFLLVSCHENEEEVTIIETNDPPRVTISTTQTARVINENGEALLNYDATYNQQQQNDLAQSFVLFDGKLVNKYGEKLTIHTASGVSSTYIVSGVENDINYSMLTVFEKRNKIEVGHDAKMNITINDETTLTTQPNTYTIDGNSYNTKVNITHFNPDLNNDVHISAIPANRVGKDINGEHKYLEIYDVFYLDVRSENGQPLETKLGIISDYLQENDLKIWSFDYDKSIWLPVKTEDNNQFFIYQKSGFYCKAKSKPGIYASGQLALENTPISNIRINLHDGQSRQSVFTSGKGKWIAFLPANADVRVDVRAACGPIETFNIKTENTTLENLKTSLDNSSQLFAKIVGQVKDCNGDLNVDYILKNHSDQTTYYFTKGSSTDIYVPVCGSEEVTLSTSTIDGNEEGNRVTWSVEEIIQTGTWFACDRAKNPYFNLIIDGTNKMYWQTKTQKNNDGRWSIDLLDEQSNVVLSIFVPDDGAGKKADTRLNILLREQSFEGQGYEIFCPTSTLGCGFEKFEITHYDFKNDNFIRGYFKGRFWVKTLSPLTAGHKNVEGEFQLKKEF
jgi:hypothetical protein